MQDSVVRKTNHFSTYHTLHLTQQQQAVWIQLHKKYFTWVSESQDSVFLTGITGNLEKEW